MAEPSSSTTGAWLGGFVATPVIYAGADLLSMGLGLASAIFVSIMTGLVDTRAKAFFGALFGTMIAGYFSPMFAVYTASKIQVFSGAYEALRLPAAIILGGTTPILGPLLKIWLVAKFNKEINSND